MMCLSFFAVAFIALHRRPTTLLSQDIVHHPAVLSLSLDSRPRRKLKQRHVRFFQGDTLLDQLGTVLCSTDVVPRKELFETYAAALVIHDAFPTTNNNVRRVADVAGGHGLLSWFLLAMDPTRSAIVIDRSMPASASIIADAMRKHFSIPETQWAYVEADISSIEPHSSTLLASVHACGSLSDTLIELAIDKGAPVAVVPCCHSVTKGYRPHTFSGMDTADVASLVEEQAAFSWSIGDVVDEVRCQTLEKAGYTIQQATIPELFTKRNRVLLGQVTDRNKLKIDTRIPRPDIFFERAVPKSPTVQARIPLADDPESIAYCRSISGRDESLERLRQSIPRHFSPVIDVSIWLCGDEDSTSFDTALEVLANACCDQVHPTVPVSCTVTKRGQVATDPSTGYTSQTYRVKYTSPASNDNETMRVPKQTARTIQKILRERMESDLGLAIR